MGLLLASGFLGGIFFGSLVKVRQVEILEDDPPTLWSLLAGSPGVLLVAFTWWPANCPAKSLAGAGLWVKEFFAAHCSHSQKNDKNDWGLRFRTFFFLFCTNSSFFWGRGGLKVWHPCFELMWWWFVKKWTISTQWTIQVLVRGKSSPGAIAVDVFA